MEEQSSPSTNEMDRSTKSTRISTDSHAAAPRDDSNTRENRGSRDSRESRGSAGTRDSISHLVGNASHSYIVTEYAGYENVAEVCFERTNGRLSSLALESLPEFLYCDSKKKTAPNNDGNGGIDAESTIDDEARDEKDEGGGNDSAIDEYGCGSNRNSEIENGEKIKSGNTQEKNNLQNRKTENTFTNSDIPRKHPINSSCAICITEFVTNANDILISLPPCQHAFHKECILPWLLKHRGYCPLCSEQVVVENEKRSSELDREEAANRLFGGNRDIGFIGSSGNGGDRSSRISSSSGTSGRSSRRGRIAGNSFGRGGNWLTRAARNMCFRRRT
ncbi:hypothetical protein ACHAXS_008969 [Conticribra weissflogii]